MMKNNELQYIGVCAYLARLYSKVPEDEQEIIKCILDDFIKEYPTRFELIRVGNGYLIERIDNEKAN